MKVGVMETKPVGFQKFVWWVFFLAATYSLSLFLQTFKAFSLTPTSQTAMPLAGALVALILSVTILLYDSYAKEKQKGKLTNSLWLFERLYDWQYSQEPEGDDGGDRS